ncbi:MAG TPA: alpha/beta fold hydrolase [Actinomycetota bacterium]|nr:alpha/beta fold hydrolase [Actinomycetota bacterium]
MPHARDGNLRIHYRDTGADATPIVLIHGHPFNSSAWGPQEDALGKSLRLVLPDLMGFGESEGPEQRAYYSVDTFAGNVLAVMDAAGIDKAIIGGLSLGGYVTFALWRLARTRIAGLVLADTKAEADNDDARATRTAQQQRIEREGISTLADEMLAGPLLSDATRADKPDVVERARRAMDNPAAGWVGALQAMKERPDSTPNLSSIDVPTLIVVGEHDAITPPALARLMHEQIAGSRLAVIPAAGHLSNLEAPSHFSGAVAEFVSEAAGGI